SYPLLEMLARLEAVEVDSYRLIREDDWRVDLDSLVARLTPRTRAIVVIQPNNPTGSCLRPAEREAVTALAAARGLAVISDEVFLDYPFGDASLRSRSLLHETGATSFVLGGLSKSAGLPQMKCAWIVAGGPSATCAEARARLDLIADTYLPVATPIQQSLDTLLRAGRLVRNQILARIRRNRAAILRRRGPAVSWDLVPGDGGWMAMLRLPRTRSDLEWSLLLMERDRVLVHPGHFYDAEEEGLLVLSLLPPEERFEAAIEKISRRIASEGG
ncbi:MAG: aminotransferase class I/II-fold pyridoxal phosphate-dependent enzyme, partial [Candidatus Eisenbacteria bacterium]|nr:aminotransferase class I/II-fold pyridoxal phosphate-dependent enzyme [Candidatus Latescibacterota bacterium]MBD3302410.1 aminotransferase class I/II-fold pyridoxal phosphate-dependent enzyme [Candidatus Eisenbacteria bacterium]